MSDPPPLVPRLPESFDGFRLELDPERQRAEVILDRPPLNIVTMAEREQLRAVFEALERRCPHPRRRPAGRRRAFFERRRDLGLSRRLARAPLAPWLEHRRPGALS
jgi:hypothetical protein